MCFGDGQINVIQLGKSEILTQVSVSDAMIR